MWDLLFQPHRSLGHCFLVYFISVVQINNFNSIIQLTNSFLSLYSANELIYSAFDLNYCLFVVLTLPLGSSLYFVFCEAFIFSFFSSMHVIIYWNIFIMTSLKYVSDNSNTSVISGFVFFHSFEIFLAINNKRGFGWLASHSLPLFGNIFKNKIKNIWDLPSSWCDQWVSIETRRFMSHYETLDFI